uniref:PDZ domain-containing protein n=1 Tax=Panagrolaimus sp. JU765 TaxID=591449 RepID=A0AC34QVQ0_9BILA
MPIGTAILSCFETSKRKDSISEPITEAEVTGEETTEEVMTTTTVPSTSQETTTGTNPCPTTSTNRKQTVAAAFHRPPPPLNWLDALEKDFDKAFVDLDLLLGEVDTDQAELVFEARQKMTSISSCFAQLVHKSQALSFRNTKLESEVETLRDELATAIASESEQQLEAQNLLLSVHSLQCQLYSKNAPHESDMIKKKIEHEIEAFRAKILPPAKMQAELQLLKKENSTLRSLINSMQTEIYGARLATKYLDKELAGRIQQIQLLGRGMRGAEHDRLWNQLEAEIHLHRHKTVIKACRGREGHRRLPCPTTDDGPHSKGIGKRRTVILRKESHEGLGISITGGKEHGVPILVSEIHPGQPGERCGNLFVGDAILTVNGISLKNVKHAEAVAILSKEMVENNELTFEVVYVSPEIDSDDEGEVMIETDDGSLINLYDVLENNQQNGIESSRSSSASNPQTSSKQSLDLPLPTA